DQMSYAFVRLVAIEIGKRLRGRGVLNDPEEIFFLRKKELVTLGQYPQVLDISSLVESRKMAYTEVTEKRPPLQIGNPDPNDPRMQTTRQQYYPESFVEGSDELKGFSASAGVIRGVARIVLSPRDFSRIKGGEILVARDAPSNWTPLFSMIGGLVLNAGRGILQHAAIIAREHKIPAVLGTKVATDVIRDGQVIRVDGTRGVVYLSDE
ncbi:MAG: PEP-utilizing protein, partial [Candidatus Tectomicrobia bacterium]|nr:PEP-utilizing protein [Candidatus Tectomicrobia bacterium]